MTILCFSFHRKMTTANVMSKLFYLCLVLVQLCKANPVINDVLVMSGNVSLQEMNSRIDRQVMFIAVDKSDDPCSTLIPDHNPVCVFCLSGACEGVSGGQKVLFVSRSDHMFCRLRYRIITTPHPRATCMPFLRQITVERSTLTRSS